MTVRAISFDVDGTLYRVRRLRVAWRLRYERGLLVALIAAREKLRHEAPSAGAEALLLRQAELVAPSFHLEVDEAKARIERLMAALPEALTRNVHPYSGVRSALEGALARGLRIAALSDYDPAEKISRLGLGDLPWAAKIGADGVGALKPHRRGFEALADALQLSPGEILHVGDREDLDVEGALAAGLRAWRFGRRNRPSCAENVFEQWRVGLFVPLCASRRAQSHKGSG